jgi:asparagine synthase (glutamine-hydrolysing)
MFLVAITRSEISQNFQKLTLEEFRIHSSIITVITDNFLSKYIPKEVGFSVMEFPRVSFGLEGALFSQFTYNEKEDTFSITRNPMSGRPIYYHINSKGEFFCSSHIFLLRTAGVPIEENIDVLPEFFVYRCVMPPNTLYKNINQLPLGCRLKVSLKNDQCEIRSITIYNLSGENKRLTSIFDCSKKVLDFLNESIITLRPFKDEIAVLLSGGVDSSLISKICQNNFGLENTYSSGYPFESPRLNIEKKYAFSAAEALGLNHHYYEPSSQKYLEGFLEAVSKAEEPLHHLQSVLFHLIWKNGIPTNKKIILCGQGGGSVFGSNYFFYFNEHRNEMPFRLMFTKPGITFIRTISKVTGKGEELVEIMDKSTSEFLLSDRRNPIWSWMEYGNINWVCEHFHVNENDIIKKRYNFIKKFSDRPIYDLWSLYSLFSDEDVTLAIWSKLAEGNNKIIYFPFYDSVLLNYVFSIPWNIKLQRPKDSLRKEIGQECNLPEFIFTRSKSSFGVNSRGWAKKGGIFEPLVPIASRVFPKKELQMMQSTDTKKVMTFWNMLNYSIWKRLCINNEPLEILLEELEL